MYLGICGSCNSVQDDDGGGLTLTKKPASFGKSCYRYEGQFKENKGEGYGTYTYASGSKYKGYWKDGIMAISTEKFKKTNNIPTLVIRSKKMNDENRPLKYENDKFLTDGEEVQVAVCKDAVEALVAIDDFISSNKEKKQCKVVFDQHGGEYGYNNLSINKEKAKEILENLSTKFKDIKISDLSCRGGTATHFLEVAQGVANKNDVNITVRSAPEDRVIVIGTKWNNNEQRFTTVIIDKEGEGESREIKMFKPENIVATSSMPKPLQVTASQVAI